MPTYALALVLVAGLIHASWNIAAKKAGGDVRFATFTGLVMMVFWAPLGIWLGIDELPRWGLLEWALIAASALLHTLYFIVLLGEQISALGVLGIAGVIGGVFLIAGGPALWRASHDPVQRARVRKGMVYGLLTGAFIASYTVVDGYAVKVALLSPILLDYIGNLLRLTLLVPTVLRDRAGAWALWQQQWKYALFVGIVSPVSYVLVLYAVKVAPLSHVAPAREVSMLFAALLGGHLLGEGDRAARLAGAACIAAGVVALALG